MHRLHDDLHEALHDLSAASATGSVHGISHGVRNSVYPGGLLSARYMCSLQQSLRDFRLCDRRLFDRQLRNRQLRKWQLCDGEWYGGGTTGSAEPARPKHSTAHPFALSSRSQ